MKTFDRITMKPDVHGGQPCLRGDIPVAWIVSRVAQGASIAQVLEQYSALEREDVVQALQYNARELNDWVN